MPNDPTIDPSGTVFEHDTYPPGTVEAYLRTRAAIREWAENSGFPLNLADHMVEHRFHDLIARIVAAVREET